MDTVIVLFNRDLRVHDHPALAAACERARQVVPLFVLDPQVPSGHRTAFLLDCLNDLRASLRARGGELFVRRGDTVTETMRLVRELSADAVYASADVSALARHRQDRLKAERVQFRRFHGVTVVPPGQLTPSGGGDHYKVFTPWGERRPSAPEHLDTAVPGRLRRRARRPGRGPHVEAEPLPAPSPVLGYPSPLTQP